MNLHADEPRKSGSHALLVSVELLSTAPSDSRSNETFQAPAADATGKTEAERRKDEAYAALGAAAKAEAGDEVLASVRVFGIIPGKNARKTERADRKAYLSACANYRIASAAWGQAVFEYEATPKGKAQRVRLDAYRARGESEAA